MVRRVVDGLQAVQQVHNFLGGEDERSALQPVGYVGFVQRLFQCSQGGAPRHENAYIRVIGVRVPLLGRLRRFRGIEDLPPLADYSVQQVGDVPGLFSPYGVYVLVQGFTEPVDSGTARMGGRRFPTVGDGSVFRLMLRSLAHPLLVNVVDPFQHRALGAEVLDQLHSISAHDLPQFAHLADVGPAEPVNRLFGIADDKQLAPLWDDLVP